MNNTPQHTISTMLTWLTQHLPIDEAKLDAERMMMHLLVVNRAYLRTWDDKPISASQQATLETWAQRRQQGEPLAYILEETEFYGLTFKVSPAVLIPRADTELLVDLALARLSSTQAWQVLDMGTGSGVIAISIATQRPLAQVSALDTSQAALAVAQDNICRHRVNIHTRQSHWFEAIPEHQRFDMIVTNPPYIAEHDPHLEQTSLPFEPRQALTSGVDGLDAIREIISQAPSRLQPQGWLLIEHGYDQGETVRDLLRQQNFTDIQTHQDLNYHDRVTLARNQHANQHA